MMSSSDGKSRDSTDCDCSQTSKPGQTSNGKADFSESEELYETEGLRILDEFKKLYESRIDEIDGNSSVPEFERISTKLKIMTEWVKDLREQNVMLVRTVEDLEQAAVSRVKLLEDKLLQSSNLVSENIIQCTNSGEALNSLTDRVSVIERDEDYLQKKIEWLQSDIRGLLELIRRAREENCWCDDGIDFREIRREDIPGSFDCTCDEEKRDAQNLQYNHNMRTLGDNEKILLEKLTELEQKLSDQNKKISEKDDLIKNFTSRMRNKFKERSPSNNIILGTSDGLNFDIMRMAEILENAFVTKDLEIETLHQRLQESNIKLEKLLHENVKFEEKNKQIKELEAQLAILQKESLESREALASEVAEKHDQVISLRKELQTLEEQCRHISMQAQFKDDIIKEMRKELKQASQKNSPCSRNVRISADQSSEEDSEKSLPQKNKILSYLTRTKQLMEKERETLCTLKEEIGKVTTELHHKEKQNIGKHIPVVYEKLQGMEALLKNYKAQVIDNTGSNEDLKKYSTDTEETLASLQSFLRNIFEVSEEKYKSNMGEIIERLCKVSCKISDINSEKEQVIALADSVVKGEPDVCDKNTCNEPTHESVITTFLQQFKRMEEFRMCTVEAQAATEDLREEMETVICNFTCRHKKYCELNKLVTEVKNYLISTKEKVFETMNQLKLQEEERSRYSDRISSGRDRLKNMKNEINQARMQFSQCVNNMQQNNQEHGSIGFAEIYTSSDVLNMVADEVEQIVSNLVVFQKKDHYAVSSLSELDSQLSFVENNLKKLFESSQEVLQENEANQRIFEEREKCIDKLKTELDYSHTQMQDVLETICAAMDQINELDIVKDEQVASENVNEIIKAKDDYHKLRKEYETLRMKMIEDSYKKELDESVNECKSQINNLLDQMRILQNEMKIGQNENCILKNNIQSLEEELNGAYKRSEANRRSHSTESMQLNRKIFDLERTLKLQKEVESNLRRSLTSSEIDLKKSKEMLNSFHTSSEGTFSSSGTQIKLEGGFRSFEVLRDTIHQTSSGIQDLKNELEKLVRERFLDSNSSTNPFTTVFYLLEKNGVNIANCSVEMEKLINTLFSKEKLLEDKEKIITIQKDTILLTQNELKDLHEKLQDKINTQDNIMINLKEDNRQLQKKIDLQEQTIGHLQNAVVQTKRCLDQMGQKSVSDNERKNEAIRTLNIFLTETQHQYSECFAEAAKQDSLLELQRDSIESLQQKIICKEYNELFKIIILHCIYSANVLNLQDQLRICISDCESLKSQINSLMKTNLSLEEKYLATKYLWEKTDSELKSCQEKQKKTVSTKYVECKIADSEMQSLQLEYNSLTEKNTNLKIELQKCNMDFEILEKELKKQNEKCLCIPNLESELERLNNEAQQLKLKWEKENEDLKVELQKNKMEFDIIQEELKKQRVELERLNSEKQMLTGELEERKNQIEEGLVELEANQREIKNLQEQANCSESIIADQTEMIEKLKVNLLSNEREAETFISELNSSREMLCILKRLLKEKSDCMAKLQADHQMLKNHNSILKMENSSIENKAKEDICESRNKMKEIQLQLCIAEDTYKTVTQDFNRSQELLLSTAKREAELQQTLTNMEKNFYSKMKCVKKEEVRLKDLVNKKNQELEQIQSACNLYSSQLENTQYDLQGLKEKILKLEETNCCFRKKLQDFKEENCALLKQKKFLEQNNCKCINELEGMHKSLVDLRKECKMKSKSLVCMTAELTQATASRSELCNESQYVVSCIRDWMEEQKNVVESLNNKVKTKQEQLMDLNFERKALQAKVKEQRRIINALLQRRKRSHRSSAGQSSKSIVNKCYSPSSGIIQIRSGPNSNYSRRPKKCIKSSRKKLMYENSWFFPKMEYLTDTLKKINDILNKKSAFQSESDQGLDENRDCGYQSSTSK